VYKEVSILDVNDSVEKAMEVITLTKRRHVLINEEGKLVAIISIGDVLFSLIDDKSRLIEHLEAYIHS
jgi:CBS domain-containing protein